MTAPADRVLVVVFDGLRPDMIAGRMPRLEAFFAEAVRFSEASSVFPSMTRVATTSTATGCWPGAHGVIGNAFHAPAIKRGAALDTSSRADIDAAEAAYGDLIAAPTLGARLAAAGRRLGAVHMGSAGSAYLINHRAPKHGHWTVSAHGEAASLTPEAVRRAVDAAGALPDADAPAPKRDAVRFAERAARDLGLAEDGPDVALVWFPEPDTSFHYLRLGSEGTRRIMAEVDAAFGRLLEAARSGPRGDRTAVIAMSDHGQISIGEDWDIAAALRADGFAAAARPSEGDRLALTLGASGEVRALTGDAGVISAAAEWLMGREEIGMVFARDDLAPGLPGTLPLSAVRLDHPRAAELAYVCRAGDGPDPFGLEGVATVTLSPAPGGGMHGGLHRRELNTLLAVSAPGGARGVVDDRPCGLPDVTPTVLALLGLPCAGAEGAALPLDGARAEAEDEVFEAARGGFRQRLHRRRIEGRAHLHRGGRA